MSWYDHLEHKLQYEETRSRNLKHYQPTPGPRRSWASLRTRLAHLLQSAAKRLETERSGSTPITE